MSLKVRSDENYVNIVIIRFICIQFVRCISLRVSVEVDLLIKMCTIFGVNDLQLSNGWQDTDLKQFEEPNRDYDVVGV